MVSRPPSRIRRFGKKLALITVCLSLAAPVVLLLPWRWLTPPTTAYMVRDRLAHDHRIVQHWLPLDAISPWLAIAVIASEDQKFPSHFGFDFDQLRAVLSDNGAPSRGASTISQQLVKNLYLWPGQSYTRKSIEAYLTLWMELLWPKQRILEVYLNVAEFGTGIYGAGAASNILFQRPAAELSPEQAALLAAVLPSPTKMSAAHPSPYVEKRALEILAAAEQLGGIDYLTEL